MKEAMLYERLEEQRVHCQLCAHRCVIPAGKRGVCQVRENQAGTLYTLVYGEAIAEAVDPVEKKPLYHFFPGSTILSVATVGCNFRCSFCQNADISQMPREWQAIRGQPLTPEQIVRDARSQGCQSIAYTYTEPTIFFEYNHEIAQLAHAAGLANVYVSNGYMTPELLAILAPGTQPPLLDAANIDLKAFRDAFYRRQCGARLQPVLDSLVRLKRGGVWLEVTTLLIPTLNDGDEELRDIARFIAGELGPETPWHVTRFHPTYRLTDLPVTPVETLHRARAIGLEEGLLYVYEGNVHNGLEDTACPTCGRSVIRRQGFAVTERNAPGGTCRFCGGQVHGVGL